MIDSMFFFNESEITNKLLSYADSERLCLKHPKFTKGAVIFLIIPHDNKPYDIILIRRTINKKDKHSGEISFPGGKFDKNQDRSLKDTALRETEEEIGIPRKKIKIIGSFDDHITPKLFIIAPFVGIIDETLILCKNQDEVDEILRIPIDFFASKKNYRERTYKLHGNKIAVGKYIYRENSKKYVIFGATCHLIVHFIQTAYNIQLMELGARRLNCQDFETRLGKI